MDDAADTTNTIALTAEIVAAYVSNNTVASADIPALISQVHTALLRVTNGEAQPPSEPLKPAVPIKRSINPDFIVCLDDGKKFKSLKRHLRTQYNMTPEQYREKWSLPGDYPMVAPNYAAAARNLPSRWAWASSGPGGDRKLLLFGISRLDARLALAISSDKIPKFVDKSAGFLGRLWKYNHDFNRLRTKHELIPAATGSAII